MKTKYILWIISLFFSLNSYCHIIGEKEEVAAWIEGDTFDHPIVAGGGSTSFTFTDTRNTANYTNSYTLRSPNDVFYEFTTQTAMDVTISHCGSVLSDTYLHLLDEWGERLYYNDDYSGTEACGNTRHSFLRIENLQAGTYYVVSEGYSSNGIITTTISGVALYVPPVANVSSGKNYILTITPTTALNYVDCIDTDQSIQHVQYFDGLGRPMQTVQVKASPSGADLVTYQEYDPFGRESNSWLPVVASGNNGAFMDSTAVVSKVPFTYPGESKPYSFPVYEPSPLNRVTQQYGPG
ncbi:hypothetical protein D0T50_03980, partial [Bacteroides sp. 214]|uniref:DUF6443 domain-containing protein n=1 Tax=Bacteroides sp. 214 TaxID=2302935 RepID=UPI001EF2F7A2